jgi:hypothetical protein
MPIRDTAECHSALQGLCQDAPMETPPARILLEGARWVQHIQGVRAHGMWTYEPRQGRKAATVVCSTSAVVTLALFNDEVRMKNAETDAVQP